MVSTYSHPGTVLLPNKLDIEKNPKITDDFSKSFKKPKSYQRSKFDPKHIEAEMTLLNQLMIRKCLKKKNSQHQYKVHLSCLEHSYVTIICHFDVLSLSLP